MGRKYSYSRDDDSDMTIKRYEEFLSGNSTSGYFDVEEFETIVEYYLRKGRTGDSSQALEMGIKLHPGSSILQVKRAKIYLVSNDPMKAFRLLDSVTEKNSPEVLLLKIEALLKLKRDNEALETCERFFSMINPADVNFAYLDVAYIYMNQCKFEIAVKLLERGQANDFNNVDLLFELAYCYEQIVDLDKAIATHQRILEIDPFVSEAWFNLGQIHFSLQDYTQALEAYDYVLAIDPSDSFCCIQKAHVLLQAERYEEAIEWYTEYGNMTFDKKQVYNYIAECYEKLENYGEAISNYKMKLEFEAENYEALTGLAICLLEQEQYEECMNYIRQAIKVQPEYPDAWVYMAEAFIGMENSESALRAYLKALERDQNQPETLVAVGNLYLEKSDYLSASFYYGLAYDQNKELEHINLFMAIVHFKLSNTELSLSYLQDAIESDENAVSIFLEMCPEASSLTDSNDLTH